MAKPEIREPVQIKVSWELLEKVRAKLKAASNAPANFVVDTALRNFVEEDCTTFFPNIRPEDRD